MKKVYFVRHGQTEGNVARINEDEKSHLTEIGKKQAEFLAKRFKDIPVDTIISSSYNRALETAQIIEYKLSAGIIISDLFIERREPQESLGRSLMDPEVISLEELLRHKSVDDKEWHYSNEENFYDLIARAKKAITFLQNREDETLVVVTHGAFLRAIIVVMMFGDEVDPQIYYKFYDFVKTRNTGITFCTYVPNAEREWVMHAWNDHAHLGEIKDN